MTCKLRSIRYYPLIGHTSMITSIALASDGSCAITGGDNGAIYWSFKKLPDIYSHILEGHSDALGGCSRCFRGHNDCVLSVALGRTSDDRFIGVTGYADGVAQVWNLDNFTFRLLYCKDEGGISSVHVDPDAQMVLTISKTPRVWDLQYPNLIEPRYIFWIRT